MASSRAVYEVKRFLSTADTGFSDALLIYIRNIADATRTNGNEIASWLDASPVDFTGHFYVFGFYRNRKVIGYAEVAYFPTDRLFVCDYIVIEKQHRTNGAFFEFFDQLRGYLEGLHPQYRYAVAEIGYGPGEQQPSQDSRLLERLLKMPGFRIIRASYFQPRLALNDSESEMPADLMVLATRAADRMQVATYLSIVHTIYYSYYLPWYSATPSTAKVYRKHLDRLYARIQSSMGRKQYVPINGHHAILPAPISSPVASAHRPLLAFSAQALIVIVALMASLVGLRSAFHLSDNFAIAVFAIALLSFLAVAGIVSKEARLIFMHSASLTKMFFGKQTTDSMPNEAEKEQIEAHYPDEP